MTDYTELQKAAAYAAQDTIKFADEDEEMRALQQFHEEVDPETVLALIAENERLQQREQDLSASVKYWFNACGGKQFEAGVKHADEAASKYIDEHWRRQRDQLRAENAGLRTGYEAYERVNAELKAEVEGLRKALTSSREFLMRDAKVRRMTDGARHISPMFPLRKLVMEQIDAALGQGEQS